MKKRDITDAEKTLLDSVFSKPSKPASYAPRMFVAGLLAGLLVAFLVAMLLLHAPFITTYTSDQPGGFIPTYPGSKYCVPVGTLNTPSTTIVTCQVGPVKH